MEEQAPLSYLKRQLLPQGSYYEKRLYERMGQMGCLGYRTLYSITRLFVFFFFYIILEQTLLFIYSIIDLLHKINGYMD